MNIEQKMRTKENILNFTLEILSSEAEEKIIVSSMQLVKLNTSTKPPLISRFQIPFCPGFETGDNEYGTKDPDY